MDDQRPRDMNPPSEEGPDRPGDAQSKKDGSRKILPYSVKLQAKAKAAGR